MRLPLLLLALLALPACDSYNNGYDDGYGDGQGNAPSSAATVVDYSLSPTNYEVSADNKTATFETDNIDSGTTRASVERALATAGDGALVMLYIRNDLVNLNPGGQAEPYSALPLTRSVDQVVLTTGTNGGTSTVPVVGYTISYEYSFDNADLYFDVVSSAASTDFGSDPRSLFDNIVPQRRNTDGTSQGLTPLRFRLVTVPARAAKQGVDMTDYAAVARAYALPD